jgi:transposase
MDSAPDIAALDESGHTSHRKSVRGPRMEIITRGERRRRWPVEQKREIVAESYSPALTPSEVAREHGISSGQLCTWRREMLGLRAPVVSRATPRFADVEVTTPLPSAASAPAPAAVAGAASMGGRIEIVLPGDVIVRVDAEVDGAALRRVLEALRRR